jgi:hypothetical protein
MHGSDDPNDAGTQCLQMLFLQWENRPFGYQAVENANSLIIPFAYFFT